MEVGGFIRKVIVGGLCLGAFIGMLITEDRLEVLEVEAEESPDLFYLPKGKVIKPLFLGHEAFAADLIWIRTLGYVGDQLYRRRKATYLGNLVDLATDLDPRFEQIYLWAGAITMYGGGLITKDKIEQSTEILKKGWRYIQNDTEGWRHVPNYWMIPQMIGFNYAIELHDKKRGAPYIAAAARIPGSPDLYKTWAATLYKKAGEWEKGTRLLEDLLVVETLTAQLENVKEKPVKARIRARLATYYARLYGEDEAARRLKDLEEKVQNLLSEWRKELPYVSLDLFLVLRGGASEFLEQEAKEIWAEVFPITSSATP